MATGWWAAQLAVLAQAEVLSHAPPPELAGHTRISAGKVAAFVPLAGVVDVESERPRLEKALAETEKLLAASAKKLGNESFRERAPAEVVAKEEAKRDEFAARVEKLRTQLDELG